MSIFEDINKICSRVIVSKEGYAKSPEKAKEEDNIVPDIIFWRQDGWTLGAPEEFEKVAYETWEKGWIRFGVAPDFIPQNMDSYVPKK